MVSFTQKWLCGSCWGIMPEFTLAKDALFVRLLVLRNESFGSRAESAPKDSSAATSVDATDVKDTSRMTAEHDALRLVASIFGSSHSTSPSLLPSGPRDVLGATIRTPGTLRYKGTVSLVAP